ncbi:hypothetical protein D187_006207 [Cystobacter fuscus DSM 2262]|uniref:BIG2 domain-containing protein n=1 Tax=Cystobacter fuscus (strain ATCC 25194 / DSM 2262 / NBRC 100088 / M29) TaxID=1242864 RepID=S9PK15_CYSF2|nr:hypothetical protein [Cystobacter fuscus]EPX62797.1 hypothetical protein D187_006207 [Cystobacter fuscus DSM 2262]
MKFSKALPWLPSLLVLAGCPGEPDPKPPQLDKVAVSCTPTTLMAGQNAQCSATATDQNGQPFTVSSYTWTSGDETLAKVDASGKVTTVVVSSGTVAIRASATSGDTTQQGEASLSLTPKPPTEHSTPVSGTETWRTSDNPHLVKAPLVVDGGATLTLEAGTVVRFAPGAELRVTQGSLRASGTSEAPILLQAQNGATRGSWNGVVFSSKDSASTLEHVTVTGCGPQSAGACLVIRGGAAPVLKDVAVRDSASTGVLVASDGSSFGAGSVRLSVSGSEGPAVRIDANQAGTLPTGGAFTDNKPNAVELTGARVLRTQTWPNPGIPFIVNEELTVGGETTPATLTLAAGTLVRFGANVGLVVGSRSIQGGLVLDGKADAPVLLTAHADAPQPGHWRGVHVMTASPHAGRISHATIEYAGKEPKPDDFVTPGRGNLNLYGKGDLASSFSVNDLITQKSSGPGIVLLEGGYFAEGSARLTSRDNATYPIFMMPNNVRTLPSGLNFRNNGINVLALMDGNIIETQTWPNLGLPYLLTSTVFVGFTPPPTLTIAAGTEIQSAQGSALLVGAQANRPGVLKAVGTADAPIRFIPDIPNAPNGHWAGLHFWQATGSQLNHVLVTHGGGNGDPFFSDVIYGSGNVNVHMQLGTEPKFLTNSTLRSAQDCAATRDSGITDYLRDPSFNNNFTDNPNDALCWNSKPN